MRSSILTTRRLRLRPIEEKDYRLLHQWRNEPKFIRFCSNRRNPVNFDQFATELKYDLRHRKHLQLLIELCDNAVPIGTVFAYDASLADGNLFMTIYLTNGYERRGYGAEAGIVFLFYLFDHFPLHKIYFDASLNNTTSISTLAKAGFVEEGRFKEHRFMDGTYHDVARFAAYRGHLERLRKIFVKSVARVE